MHTSRSLGRTSRAAAAIAAGSAMLTALVFGQADAANATGETRLYVSVAATGTGDCSSAANACTLATAKTSVRTLTSGTLAADVIVDLADGTYSLSAPLDFTTADSGNNGHTVVWRAAAGAKPVLSGGTGVSGWALVSGSTNLYSASVPVRTTGRQLYVNDRRAQRAAVSGDQLSNWMQTATGYVVTKSPKITNSRATDLEFVYPGGAGATNWTSNRCSVASVATDPADATKDVITMTQPCYTNARQQYPNVQLPNSIENGFGMLGTPGEWYLDSAAGKIYYSPLVGETLTNSSAILGTTDGLLTATNLSRVTFSGLTFKYGTWSGASGPDGVVDTQANLLKKGSPHSTFQLPASVAFHASSDITFSSNTLSHLGGEGVAFDRGGSNNSIVGNHIYDTSGGGITLGTGNFTEGSLAPPYLEDKQIVTNNYVHDIGVEYGGAVGIFANWVKNTTIAHNEVFRTSYSGISLGWGWGNTSAPAYMVNNHVDYNYVHDVMVSSVTDGGAIYLSGMEGASPGSTVIGNYVDGNSKPFGSIYLDNGSSNFTVANNVVTNTAVTNSIFVATHDWGDPNTAAKYNTIKDNYGSSTAGAIRNGDATNTVTNNQFNLTSWPAAAVSIINSAGLEGDYVGINPTPLMNLALRGTATASSSYGSEYLPARANDSSAHSLWSSSSTDTAAWWQVDLGSSQTVDSLILLQRDDGNYGWADRTNLQVIGSNNADMSSSTTLCTIGANAVPFAQPTSCKVNGQALRYVRVKKTDGTGFTLGEFRVYGPGARVPGSPLTPGNGWVDDTSTAITYTPSAGGGWTQQTYAGLFKDTQTYSVKNGDSFTYSFKGTGIDYLSTKFTNRGGFTYTIDGGAAQTGTCYSATAVDQQPCLSVRDLTLGSHTLTVTKTGGTYFTVDALKVRG